jgi:hypothetical protein
LTNHPASLPILQQPKLNNKKIIDPNMNFRVLATRLKESASEVALKIPTFDDMAAKDTYIHSDDTDNLYNFNIPLEQQQQQQQDAQGGPTTRNSSANRNKNTKEQQKHPEPHPSIQSPRPQQHPVTLQLRNEGDETSSHGSGWSLLDRDRRAGRASPVIHKNEVLVSPLASTISSLQQQQQQQQQPSPMPNKNSIRKKPPQTSLPILSAVADALLEDPATSRRDDTSISMMSDSSSNTDDKDDDDDDSDDDDPILSMIRKSQPENLQTKKPHGIKEKQQLKSSVSSLSSSSSRREHQTPLQQVVNHQQKHHSHPTKEENVRLLQATDERRSSWSSRGSYHDRSDLAAASDGDDFRTPQENGRKKKSPQRFLNDLDQRLSSTPDPFDIESGEATNAQSLSSSNLVVNRLGGWVKTIASGNVDQWLGRTPTTTQDGTNSKILSTNALSWMTTKFREPTSQQQQQQQHRPPLARLPKVATTASLSPENDFSVTNSTSIVLADDELAQLAQFKTRASTMWDMMVTVHTWMKENRQFAFIGATMLLAAFVYFYKGAASGRQN